MVIHPSDRVADVLGRSERLIDTFIDVSPVFEKLRNPLMRRTMGRLATVEQAARVAGVDAALLTSRLNAALNAEQNTAQNAPQNADRASAANGAAGDTSATGAAAVIRRTPDAPDAPAALAAIPERLIHDLDVREDLRNGKEPFSRIMAARREVPAGGVLRLRAIFEPAPLYVVMRRQGFDHWTERLADDDWRVWFYPAAPAVGSAAPAGGPATPVGEPAAAADGSAAPAAADAGTDDDVVVIDVRGMDPPEPMVRTLAALENLPTGRTLLQINERVPQFLLPKLEGLGFTYEVREQSDALFRIFIRRRSDA